MLTKQRSQATEEVENVLIWVNKKAGERMSETIICEKAKQVHADPVKNTPGTSAATSDASSASRGWFEKLRKRSGMHSV